MTFDPNAKHNSLFDGNRKRRVRHRRAPGFDFSKIGKCSQSTQKVSQVPFTHNINSIRDRKLRHTLNDNDGFNDSRYRKSVGLSGDSNTVFVNNLPENAGNIKSKLEEILGYNCFNFRKKNNHCFMSFNSRWKMNNAIKELNNIELEGTKICVKVAKRPMNRSLAEEFRKNLQLMGKKCELDDTELLILEKAHRSLFVGNLPNNIKKSDIMRYFRKYGDIIDANIMKSAQNKLSYALVVYASIRDCNNAYKQLFSHPPSVNGVKVSIQLSKPPIKLLSAVTNLGLYDNEGRATQLLHNIFNLMYPRNAINNNINMNTDNKTQQMQQPIHQHQPSIVRPPVRPIMQPQIQQPIQPIQQMQPMQIQSQSQTPYPSVDNNNRLNSMNGVESSLSIPHINSTFDDRSMRSERSQSDISDDNSNELPVGNPRLSENETTQSSASNTKYSQNSIQFFTARDQIIDFDPKSQLLQIQRENGDVEHELLGSVSLYYILPQVDTFLKNFQNTMRVENRNKTESKNNENNNNKKKDFNNKKNQINLVPDRSIQEEEDEKADILNTNDTQKNNKKKHTTDIDIMIDDDDDDNNIITANDKNIGVEQLLLTDQIDEQKKSQKPTQKLKPNSNIKNFNFYKGSTQNINHIAAGASINNIAAGGVNLGNLHIVLPNVTNGNNLLSSILGINNQQHLNQQNSNQENKNTLNSGVFCPSNIRSDKFSKSRPQPNISNPSKQICEMSPISQSPPIPKRYQQQPLGSHKKL